MIRKIRIRPLALMALILAPNLAFAQAPEVGRTPDGHPDLQGVWATEFVTRLERTKEASSLEVSADEARRIADAITAMARESEVDDPDFAHYGYDQLATVRGVFRSSLIVDPPDGKIPYSPAGVELAERFGRLESYGYDHPEERPPYERCVSGILAAPIRTLALFIPIRIVQTSDRIVMTNEDAQGLRIVPIGEPLPPALPRFEGRASARWDGDTLVVETTDFRHDDIARPDIGPPIVLSPSTLITERFTRTSHDILLYQFTIEDSVLYTKPWRAEYEYRLAEKGAVYEYACHEGNRSIVNALLAARMGRQPSPPKN